MAYTAGDTLVRAVMQAASGLPRDTVINDFAFKAAASPTPTEVGMMISVVNEFYRTTQASSRKVGEYISNQINRAATHELQAYHITAGPLGSPFYTEDWLGPPTALTATGVPTEVAAVLSFHADLTGAAEESGATRPRARRRGRVFIGPLTGGAIVQSAPPYTLDASFTLVLREAAVKLMDDAEAAGVPWCVWSREDATLRPVVGGWTDNAPDTQRRRGFRATTRNVWG